MHLDRDLQQLASFIKNLVFPPQCSLCQEIIGDDGVLCPKCWGELDFITDPLCAICGDPFEYYLGDNIVCAKCTYKRPPYDRALSVLKINTTALSLIHALKYHDKTHLAKHLARIMVAGKKHMLADFDIITCIPMHRLKLLARYYNQAAMLAYYINKEVKKAYIPDLLLKTKNTVSQTTLGHSSRLNNVVGTFACNKKYHNLIDGKKIVIIDDVITTGATCSECAQIFKKSGAANVMILTLARTTKDSKNMTPYLGSTPEAGMIY
jgi:ComF family protein